jgi:hypothetical protein
MISVLEIAPNVLGYTINGKIEKQDVERVIADMDAKVPTAHKVRLFVEVMSLDGMTPQAFFRDMQLGIPRTNYLIRIERLAVVAESEAVQTFVNAQARLTRWFETRVFGAGQRAEAIAWISEV